MGGEQGTPNASEIQGGIFREEMRSRANTTEVFFFKLVMWMGRLVFASHAVRRSCLSCLSCLSSQGSVFGAWSSPGVEGGLSQPPPPHNTFQSLGFHALGKVFRHPHRLFSHFLLISFYFLFAASPFYPVLLGAPVCPFSSLPLRCPPAFRHKLASLPFPLLRCPAISSCSLSFRSLHKPQRKRLLTSPPRASYAWSSFFLRPWGVTGPCFLSPLLSLIISLVDGRKQILQWIPSCFGF